jgi:hypothetical protein
MILLCSRLWSAAARLRSAPAMATTARSSEFLQAAEPSPAPMSRGG